MPKPDRPQTGWQPVQVLDGDTFAGPCWPPLCERCGRKLRWVHVVTHVHWELDLHVGCCCANQLCGDDYDARTAERSVISRAARLTTFLRDDRWYRNFKGNVVRRPICGATVTIFPSRNGLGYACCVYSKTSAPAFGRPVATIEAAKAEAFDLLEDRRNA